MKEVGDRFGAGELILPFVLQSAEVMKKAVSHLEQLPGTQGRHQQGHGGAGHGLRRCARYRQEPGQDHPGQQRLHGDRPGQTGAGRDDHHQGGRGQGRRHRAERPAGQHQQADAADRQRAAAPRAEVPGADRRRGHQPPLRPAHPVHRRRQLLRAGRVLLQGRLRRSGDDGRPDRPAAAPGFAGAACRQKPSREMRPRRTSRRPAAARPALSGAAGSAHPCPPP